ncbi:unnamed protein product, partial [Laminaria digitata]
MVGREKPGAPDTCMLAKTEGDFIGGLECTAGKEGGIAFEYETLSFARCRTAPAYINDSWWIGAPPVASRWRHLRFHLPPLAFPPPSEIGGIVCSVRFGQEMTIERKRSLYQYQWL